MGALFAISGGVISVDREPTFVDGDAIVVVDSIRHGHVSVLVPARTQLCQARGMEVATSARPGDRLRVSGEAMGRARLSACRSSDHEVLRLPQ